MRSTVGSKVRALLKSYGIPSEQELPTYADAVTTHEYDARTGVTSARVWDLGGGNMRFWVSEPSWTEEESERAMRLWSGCPTADDVWRSPPIGAAC